MNIFKRNRFFLVGFFAVVSFFLYTTGCATVKPMNLDTIDKYGLNSNIEMYKQFQYFISRDIILSSAEVQTDRSVSGQAFVNTRINRNIKQFLASTPGVCLEINVTGDVLKLGIAFEEDNDSLLWFFFNASNGLFFLDYSNNGGREVIYAGSPYKVTFEQGKGFKAMWRRLFTKDRTKGSNFRRMEPLLLFEENTKRTEKEKRATVKGRRL